MATATAHTRQLPGDLEFLTPHCPICAEYTDAEDGGFSCYGCGIAWDKRGENPYRIDPDAKQCPSLYVPGYGNAVEYRCWQNAGHDGEHHNPESFWSWATAAQAGEAPA